VTNSSPGICPFVGVKTFYYGRCHAVEMLAEIHEFMCILEAFHQNSDCTEWVLFFHPLQTNARSMS